VAVKEDEKKDDGMWPLRDVIFVDDVKSLPVGKYFRFFFMFVISHYSVLIIIIILLLFKKI
jgi:hypothetical protein